MILNRSLLAAAVLAPCLAVPALAQQAGGYFNRYTGSWTGGGMVKIEQLSSPMNVSCKTAGQPGGSDGFTLAGNCRALLIMNKNINASLTLDRKTGVYTGVYTGSSSGPAKLRGKLKGNTLVLKVTWGRVIYDDNVAQMLISNAGNGAFSLKVVEQIKGKSVTVSDLNFSKA